VTTPEACELAISLTREVSTSRGEARAWRLVAVAAINHANALHTELERLRNSHRRLLDEFRANRREAA
jgi:hypothetical protein